MYKLLKINIQIILLVIISPAGGVLLNSNLIRNKPAVFNKEHELEFSIQKGVKTAKHFFL